MKHFKNFLTILLLLCSTAASAHDFEVGGVFYSITSSADKTVAVTYSGPYSGAVADEYTGAVVIPATVTHNNITYSVTSIGNEAFRYCSGLTSITIPNSVTTIGDWAFHNCTGLTSVTIPNSVTIIGNYAFYYCTGLTSITIPNSVTSIGDWAFCECTGLTSITIPNSVTSIGNSAFMYCYELTDIIIPNSVTSIGEQAFNRCRGLTSITIPNSVTSIGEGAFSGCTGLTSIVVDAGNSVYDSREGCNAIIETATNTLVAGCKNTIIPNSVTTIGNRAFYECDGLTSITIPNSVTTIGNNAFEYCYRLKSITIPNSVTTIGDYAFSSCENITSIVVDAGNGVYDSRGGCNAIIETATNTLVAGCKNTIIPNSVTSIGNGAFRACFYLTDIIIPNSVTSIGKQAFSQCGLTSITIPNSVTSIGNSAFGGCSGLTSIIIPNSVTSIGNYAFQGCSGLTDVYCFATTVPSTKSDAFYEMPLANVTLHVLAEARESYRSTAPWNSFGTIKTIPVTEINGINYILNTDTNTATVIARSEKYSDDITIPDNIVYDNATFSVTSIGEGAFSHCTGLTSVTIPNSVTSIGANAFSNCTGLKTVYNFSSLNIVKGSTDNGYVAYYADEVINAPNGSIEGDYIFDVIDGVNTLCEYIGNGGDIVLPEDCNGENYTIGVDAFRGNTAITSVTIPNNVTSIGTSAFYRCSGLTSVKLGKNVTTLGDYAFQYCTSLSDITLPNSLQTIGKASLSHCGFTNVVIPNKVKTIGYYAFDYCENLAQVTIGNCVTSIGNYAFDGCTNLKTVYNFSSLNIVKDSTDNGYVAYYADKVINAPYGHIEGDFVFERKGNFTTADGLPGTVTGSNHIWESPVINCSTNGVRITVLATNGGSNKYYYAGYPIVALGELEIYDGNGNKINYTASDVTTNSLEGTEGSLAALCDGNYSTFYHSTWSGNGTKPTDYVYLDIKFPQTVDAFKFKMVGRNTRALVPTEIQVTPGKYSLVAYVGNDTALVLPENCNGENYVIGRNVFHNNTAITSVTIPASVTSIDDLAFSGCSNLTSIEIPGSVTSIGYSAFRGCTGLTSIEIPSSVTSIGEYAFCGCTGLTSIEIPSSVTSIGYAAFEGCTGLTSITVNSGNSVYDSREGCNAIIETATNTLIAGCKNTIIPGSVTSIEGWAFGDCSGLTSVTIPGSVTSIGYAAFYGCTGLTSIEIPNSVTSIGYNTFYGCTGLTSITVNSGNSVYDSREGCNAIIETATNTLIAGCKNTIIPGSVTSIGDDAFGGCTGLTSIEIPNSVTSIGYAAFKGCSGLTSVTIPNSVTSIGNNAFYDCSGLANVTIGNSVTSIGGFAFHNCDRLTSIEIPNSVTSIGFAAFFGCTGLTSIEIPNSVTSIGDDAFYYCRGLKSVTIGNSVTNIGSGAFEDCTSLTEVYVNAKTPPTIDSSTFDNYSVTLYVPEGAKDVYSVVDYWKNFTNIVEETILGDVDGDGSIDVADATTLVSMILDNSLATDAADVDGDGTVDVADVTSLVSIILGTRTANDAPAKAAATRAGEISTVSADGDGSTLLINIDNPGYPFSAIQFDLELPEGIEVDFDGEYYAVDLGSRTNSRKHSYPECAIQPDGSLRVVIISMSNALYNGTTGDVATAALKVNGAADGDYRFTIKNVVLSAPGSKEKLEPYTGWINVTGGVTGISEIKEERAESNDIYDLQGRKVTEPVKGGIYIVNGKKVVVNE